MIDYKKIGFKAGLEIHQQLDSKKLFCNCPSVLRNDSPLFEVKRKLHLVAGESGEVDVAAKYQHSLDKSFIYQGYDSTCLVELDEEPPHKINSEALRIALEISLLLNCKIIPLTQVMRKTVINGSNTSGFQRTAMIARDGFIETSEGKVGIDSVYLEEDSARPVDKTDDTVVYRLDRLGIPLVEISTKPDLKSARQVKEAALMIGEILRSSKVKRGLGTIRQDLNISIKGANRVEIKGFQDPKIMEKTIDTEILRQQFYLNLKDKVPKFKQNKLIDVTEIFFPKPEWMKKEISNGARFIAFKVEGFSGLFKKKGDENYWLGHEVANLGKSKGFGGIIHSDEDLAKYKFDDDEIKKLEKELGVKENDLWILLIGNKDKISSLVNELIYPFLAHLKEGNSKEVRNCLADGTTEFSRPMPGADRMYPETDLELLHLGKDLVNEVKKNLPKLRSEIEEDLRREGLSEDMLLVLFKSNKFPEFKAINDCIKNPKLVGKALLFLPREIAAKSGKELEEVEEILNVDVLILVLEKIISHEINESDLKFILEKIVEGVAPAEAIKLEKKDINEIEEKVLKMMKDKPGLTANAYMGLVMKEFKGKISGSEAKEIIERLMKD